MSVWCNVEENSLFTAHFAVIFADAFKLTCTHTQKTLKVILLQSSCCTEGFNSTPFVFKITKRELSEATKKGVNNHFCVLIVRKLKQDEHNLINLR